MLPARRPANQPSRLSVLLRISRTQDRKYAHLTKDGNPNYEVFLDRQEDFLNLKSTPIKI